MAMMAGELERVLTDHLGSPVTLRAEPVHRGDGAVGLPVGGRWIRADYEDAHRSSCKLASIASSTTSQR